MANDQARILVTYASEFGSTIGVANTIAERLREHGAIVDVQPVVAVRDLRSYRAVVVGSAIYNGAWLPEAVQFVRFFAAELYDKPVAYFLVSMTMREDTPENRHHARAFLDPVIEGAPDVVPIDIGLFAGSIDVRKLPWWIRVQMRLTTRLRHGDLRNWAAIRAWADQIAPSLLATTVADPTPKPDPPPVQAEQPEQAHQ
jgi:menaquinone-dependent protoporphyrinogen oxidase